VTESEQLPRGAAERLAAALGVDSAFPWQEALLAMLISGRLPRALDIPTGLGKTSIMAIWLVARTTGARLPRRLVYVVDRRAVVDQATGVAVGLRAWVDASPQVKAALGLAPSGHLPISTLRGQFADNREWLADPSAPAIVLGTVDMVGSRLLFEGYGVSRRMRPYQAGLLGADSLVVLDEAHLVPPFEALVASIADGAESFGPRDEASRAVVPPFRMVSLSATGRATKDTFTLGAGDAAHAIVQRRLGAKKGLILRAAIDPEAKPLADVLADEAWDLASQGSRPVRCLVFCDRRQDAQAVEARLRDLAAGDAPNDVAPTDIDIELFVGGRRVQEREAAATWLTERGFIAGHRRAPSRATFVVATSAGEVGVDLDADHMVSDLVAWERMVQRLGRVNRRGHGDATVVVVPTIADEATQKALAREVKLSRTACGPSDDGGPAGAADDDAEPAEPEGDATDDGGNKGMTLRHQERVLVRRHEILQAARLAIEQLPRAGAALDASPGALRTLKQRSRDDRALAALLARATTPAPPRPALTRPILESWSMTSLADHTARPEVQPWLRGWIDDEPQTTIVWRRYLPVREDSSLPPTREIEGFFEAAPPHLLERLETETFRALKWFEKRLNVIAKRTKTAGVSDEAAPDEARVDAAGDPDSPVAAPPTVRARPPLHSDDVAAFLLSPSGELAPIRGTAFEGGKSARDALGRQLVGATLVVDERVGGLATTGLLADDEDVASDVGETRALPSRVRVVAATVSPSDAAGAWREEMRIAMALDQEGIAKRWLVVETDRDTAAITEEGRSTSQPQRLAEHEEWAERHARALGIRLGLDQRYVDLLALAARLHDEGKKARLWQRAFNAPQDGPWGKTAGRPNIKLLDGYRHEFGSLPHAEADARVTRLDSELRDLCLHLIVAHHGFARPVIRTDGCEDAPPSALVARARAVALRFTRLEKEWGPWGLAWWESLLRAADQQASRENDERGPTHG